MHLDGIDVVAIRVVSPVTLRANCIAGRRTRLELRRAAQAAMKSAPNG